MKLIKKEKENPRRSFHNKVNWMYCLCLLRIINYFGFASSIHVTTVIWSGRYTKVFVKRSLREIQYT